MDKLAQRLMLEQVKPTLEKILDGGGASEAELMATGQLVDIAKDLVEYDIMCHKLKGLKPGGDGYDDDAPMRKPV